jgi:glycosyltransferase involved in cell wall biosynthesis
MKICLVTAFPPSREALNEYGFYLAQELRSRSDVSLSILGDDDFPQHQPELEGFDVVRCWSLNGLKNPFRLLREIRRISPDVVWFNLGFASFGNKPIAAFEGLAIPALIRMAGFHTHITLHQLMEAVDLEDAGVRFCLPYRIAGFVGTHMLLCSNSVSVMLPSYCEILEQKYGRGDVSLRPHGIPSARPEYPDFSRRGNPDHRILAFGKWGTYKRLEPIIDAFEIVVRKFPKAELVIAGTDHPKTPGYLKSIEQRCWRQERVRFVGYVPEEEVPALFQSASLTAMPYSSSAGSSGIAHLACAYGVPIVASDIPDFRQLAVEEGLAIEYFNPGDTRALADRLLSVLSDPERQMEMAIQNVSAAVQMSMPEIVNQYLQSFERNMARKRLVSARVVRAKMRNLAVRVRDNFRAA